MEYEIEDDALLFDDSTNPSLRHEDNPPPPQPRRPDRRRLQKAEAIPEEERV